MSGPTFVHIGYQCKNCGRTSVEQFDCNCIVTSVSPKEIAKVIDAHERAHAIGFVTGTSNWAATIARAFTKRQTAKISPIEQDAMGIAMVAAWSVGGRTDEVHPDFQCGFEAGWNLQKSEYERACKLVADMHAAGMGARVGPIVGLVEDIAALAEQRDVLLRKVADLRAQRDGLRAQVARTPLTKQLIREHAQAATAEEWWDETDTGWHMGMNYEVFARAIEREHSITEESTPWLTNHVVSQK